MFAASLRKLMREVFPSRKKGPLTVELQNLRVNILRSQRRRGELYEEFVKSGMPCCPSCAFPEYSDLQAKQRRQEARVQQLEAKIRRDDPRRSQNKETYAN